MREKRQEDFDAFVGKLKEYSKSDKPSTLIITPRCLIGLGRLMRLVYSMGGSERSAGAGEEEDAGAATAGGVAGTEA